MNYRTDHWFGIPFVVRIDGSSWLASASLAFSGAARMPRRSPALPVAVRVDHCWFPENRTSREPSIGSGGRSAPSPCSATCSRMNCRSTCASGVYWPALARGDELALGNCGGCGAVIVLDRAAFGAPSCLHCGDRAAGKTRYRSQNGWALVPEFQFAFRHSAYLAISQPFE
jgi:hypothetical protein